MGCENMYQDLLLSPKNQALKRFDLRGPTMSTNLLLETVAAELEQILIPSTWGLTGGAIGFSWDHYPLIIEAGNKQWMKNQNRYNMAHTRKVFLANFLLYSGTLPSFPV